MPPPQVLGFTGPNDFKAHFFKHFVRAVVHANRAGISIRIMFAERHWMHVFWRDGEAFDLHRAERMPWILTVLKAPEAIHKGHEGDREVYILTKEKWGEDFCVVVERTRRRDRCQFVTAYSPEPWNMLKIRFSNQRLWP